VTTNNVISQLNIKRSSDGYDTYYIGPELKYVGSLATSNNHNLEEQMIMGVDRQIVSYYDEVNKAQIEIIDFRRNSDTKYYTLEKIKYDGDYGMSVAYVQGNVLNFNTSNIFCSQDHILDQNEYDPNMIFTDNKFDITSDSILEVDTLYYTDPDDTSVPDGKKAISIKTTMRITKGGHSMIVETVQEP